MNVTEYDLPEGKLFVGGIWEEGTGAEITSLFPADGSLNRVLRGASAADEALSFGFGALGGRAGDRRTRDDEDDEEDELGGLY